MIGYVETTRNINAVHRQFIKREGIMLPGQLIFDVEYCSDRDNGAVAHRREILAGVVELEVGEGLA